MKTVQLYGGKNKLKIKTKKSEQAIYKNENF